MKRRKKKRKRRKPKQEKATAQERRKKKRQPISQKRKRKRKSNKQVVKGKRRKQCGTSLVINGNYSSLLYFLHKLGRYNFGELGEKTFRPYQFFSLLFSPTKYP